MKTGQQLFRIRGSAQGVGVNVTDPRAGGVKRAGLWPVLQRRGIRRPSIQVKDVVPDALDGTDPQGLQPQVCLMADKTTDVDNSQW